MRILLSAANFCIEPLPVYPLGMGVVARTLFEAGHTVEQFDPLMYTRDGFSAAAKQVFESFRPDAIGISIRNVDVADSQSANDEFFNEIIKVVKCWRDIASCPIVLGGSGFSMNAEKILAVTGADYGITGEGEEAVRELFRALAEGKAPPRGTILKGGAATILGAVYSRPIGDWYNRETHNIPIQTKRGCPFGCVYCTYPALEGHKLRSRDVDDVLGDIELVKKNWPDSMVYFTDSVFNDPSRLWEELLRKMVERKLVVPWTGFITPHRLSSDDIALMVDSGLICADLGVDGATDITLAGFGKSFTFDEVRRCCRELLNKRVTVNANAMFGGPGETWETVREGIANIRSLEPVFSVIFSGIRILSGAPLFEQARREGKVPPDWNDTKPLYYYAPGIDAGRLDRELREGFAGSRYCIYPPASRSDDFRRLHKFGFAKLHALHLSLDLDTTGTAEAGK